MSGIITLCYRKIIDASLSKPWEQFVFNDSYQELKLQAQFFNQEKKYTNFAQLMQHSPGSEKLHFLVSASIIGYIKQLNEVVPDIVNNLGKHFLKFNQFYFEIINSDFSDISKHQTAVSFFSEPLTWHNTIGDYLLISDKEETPNGFTTHMVKLQPFLSIHSLKPLQL